MHDEIECEGALGRICSRVMSKCHGLARVVSRVGREKKPVFIDLSRCHGSIPPKEQSTVQSPKLGGTGPRESAKIALNRAKPGFESADKDAYLFCNILFRLVRISKILTRLGRLGRIPGRLGTDVGTDETCKIANVFRPWDGGTDKLGINWGGEGVSQALCPPGFSWFGERG
jgi:hypothetical protein